jgi:hypothetical protein
MAKNEPNPLLLVDGSKESSDAMMDLIEAKLAFTPVPADGQGPVLFTHERTFRGKNGIERYIVKIKKHSGAR